MTAPPLLRPAAPAPPRPEVLRLWHGFLTGRAMTALALLVLQGISQWMAPESGLVWRLLLGGLYLAVTLWQRVGARQGPPAADALWAWAPLLGVDLAVIAALQSLHQGQWAFSPLFGLPILMAAVMGSLRLALGTTAAATLLMLGWSAWLVWRHDPHGSQRLLEAGLKSAAYFIAAVVVHELAQRLQRAHLEVEGQRASARMQAQLSALLVQPWDEGVLAIDGQDQLRMANPAALRLLHLPPTQALPLALASQAAWTPLHRLARHCLQEQDTVSTALALPGTEGRPLRLHARAWPLIDPEATPDAKTEPLCVVFLQDQRELEARVRTDQLAAMGRMSAAMAHEIRNPLAAIVQASDLLAEDLREPGAQRLVHLVQQNAGRLARIAEDILDIARVQQTRQPGADLPLPLDHSAAQCCADWQAQAPAGVRLQTAWGTGEHHVAFDAEHLRRLLNNLLDNGARHASGAPGSLAVRTGWGPEGEARLTVWSDGAALDTSVERHLFEPFFSSNSRSSGLGLYLCRELCQRHGARIGYTRRPEQAGQAGAPEGNAFTVDFRSAGTAQRYPTLSDLPAR